MTEKAFQNWVLTVAYLNRWRVYHTHDSRRSVPGFPDLVLVKGKQLIFAELKTKRGNLSTPQKEWLDALRLTGVTAEVWRPQGETAILALLEGKGQ